MDEDQSDVDAQYLRVKDLDLNKQEIEGAKLASRCHARAHQAYTLLTEINMYPSIDKIGTEGAKALFVLGVHSYFELMEEFLNAFITVHKKDRDLSYSRAIPPLHDRLSIKNNRYQYFGTNWWSGDDGIFFLVTVKDFIHVNNRRQDYGMEPVNKPHVITTGADEEYPLGRGLAEYTDQRDMSESEYNTYIKYYMKDYSLHARNT